PRRDWPYRVVRESRTAGRCDRREPQMAESARAIVPRHLHRGGVVCVTNSAAAVDQYYSSLCTRGVEYFGDRLARDGPGRAARERQYCLAAQRAQDDRLALPGRRGGSECMGESAGANQRG